MQGLARSRRSRLPIGTDCRWRGSTRNYNIAAVATDIETVAQLSGAAPDGYTRMFEVQVFTTTRYRGESYW